MISVTAAANSFRRVSNSSLSQRPSFGAHFKAFGNGRITISPIVPEADDDEHRNIEPKAKKTPPSFPTFNGTVINYFIHAFYIWFKLFVYAGTVFARYLNKISTKLVHRKKVTVLNADSLFHRLNDKVILKIFSNLPANDLILAKFTCRKFRELVDSNANDLSKFQVDQVKLHFDEGEFIIYPLDERIVPIRRAMHSIESLLAHLGHITTLSLFIRGLIPIETGPVLKRLAKLRLNPTQIYFLWCDFNKDAEQFLKILFHVNAEFITDIGFEVCSPPNVISDELIRENLHQLISLRIWNEPTRVDQDQHHSVRRDCERNENYAITDATLARLSRIYSCGASRLEVIDLAGTECTVDGLLGLIEAWFRRPPAANLSISLLNSKSRNVNCQIEELAQSCKALDIPFAEHGIPHQNGFNLFLYIT